MADDAENGYNAQDHALLLAVSHEELVEVWHLGQVNGVLNYQSVSLGAMMITECEEPVVDMTFSPDSSVVAVASLDGFVRFFSVNTEKKVPQNLHKWQPHEGRPVTGIYFLDNLTELNSESVVC